MLNKKDFIEIEFTGKLKSGEVFDSNIKADIEKAGLKTPAKPFIFCLGQGMFLAGIDDFLIGKEIGKEYKIELQAENAFGKRENNLIKLIPLDIFRQHKLNPVPGVMFNFDGRLAKILSVNGGRVRVDFNNPLAGKDVEYKIKVLRKLDSAEEQISAFSEFLFRKKFHFSIKDKKLLMKVDKPLVKFVELFKEKFQELFGLELEVQELEEKEKPSAK